MTTAETDTTISTLAALLRCELAAAAAYDQAERRLRGRPESAELRRIREEHTRAADDLRQALQRQGGRQPGGARAWGALAALVEGAAALLGPRVALRVLSEVEGQCIEDYECALDGAALPADCQALVAGALLPRCREHVDALARLLARQEEEHPEPPKRGGLRGRCLGWLLGRT